jgi:hypothetical protein
MSRLPVAVGMVVAIAAGTLSGCGESPREASRQDSSATIAHDSSNAGATGVDTAARYSAKLPPGRFQLPTRVTAAPDLWITLPEGYRVKGASERTGDRFFIVNTNDPGLTDSTAVTPGFMRIYVGHDEQRPFEDVKTSEGERVLVAGFPLQWRLASESLPSGGTYRQAELSSGDFFSRFSPELSREALVLHVYVAGADSAKVGDLMKAAESLSIVP